MKSEAEVIKALEVIEPQAMLVSLREGNHPSDRAVLARWALLNWILEREDGESFERILALTGSLTGMVKDVLALIAEKENKDGQDQNQKAAEPDSSTESTKEAGTSGVRDMRRSRRTSHRPKRL